jgi:hypothetical protein
MKCLIGLSLVLSALVLEAQPILFEWSVEDEGKVFIDNPLGDAGSFFFNTGFPIYYHYTLIPSSKRALRKQEQAQKEYNNTLVIDWQDEALEKEAFSAIVPSPFQQIRPNNNFFYPFWNFYTPDTTKTWETYNYSETDYNCRGGMWISNYFIDTRRGSNQLPDSIISGSVYREDTLERKVPKTLWRYWYTKQNQFERIVISNLAYPDEVYKTIITFNYDKKQRLRQVISFSDTLEGTSYPDADALVTKLEAGFYLDRDEMNDTLLALTNPDSGLALKTFINYTYQGNHLVRTLAYVDSWLSILKDSLVYENDRPREIYRFNEKGSCSIDRFEYDTQHKLSRYLCFRYVSPNQKEPSEALIDRRFEYLTRKEMNLRQEKETDAGDN